MITFRVWGKKADVVKIAAIVLIIVSVDISIFIFFKHFVIIIIILKVLIRNKLFDIAFEKLPHYIHMITQ
jgi:hypothetical protein